MGLQSDLDSLHDLVQAGQLHRGRMLLSRLSRRNLDRSQRLQLAQLANQCSAHRRALSLLYRAVRPTELARFRGTDDERFEYATALLNLGANLEGIEILQSMRSAYEARAVGLMAWGYFKLWDWTTPLPWLEKVANRSGLADRERLRAKTQLALALLHGLDDIPRARDMLVELAAETADSRFAMFHWDALQILVQTYYLEGDWKGAGHVLDQVEALALNQTEERPRLVTLKWRQLIGLQSSRTRLESTRGLDATKRASLAVGHWEQARSCDFYRAIALKDRELLYHLCFGSPYPALKRKLLTAFRVRESELPSAYDLHLGPRREKKALHVLDGRNDFGAAHLTPGGIPQRLLCALTRDFYAPPNGTQLHGLIYPGQHLNPATSYDCVDKGIQALRLWLREEGIPLELLKRDRFVFLASKTGLILHIENEPAWLISRQDLLPKVKQLVMAVKERFRDGPFKACDLEVLLGLTRPTVVSLLNSAVASGVLLKIGNGPQTRYRVHSEPYP